MLAITWSWAAAMPWLVIASLVFLVVGMVAFPLLIIAMPADYFARPRARFAWIRGRFPMLRLLLLFVKNGVGLLLMAAGLVMLLTPGQGILSLLVGLCLTDLPGKRRFERWMLGYRGVLSTLNSIRRKAGKPPLQMPSKDSEMQTSE